MSSLAFKILFVLTKLFKLLLAEKETDITAYTQKERGVLHSLLNAIKDVYCAFMCVL